jgi:BRCT domain type II-containing protein
LLVGMRCGRRKIKEARELGIAVIDEDGLFAMVRAEAEKAERERIVMIEGIKRRQVEVARCSQVKRGDTEVKRGDPKNA